MEAMLMLSYPERTRRTRINFSFILAIIAIHLDSSYVICLFAYTLGIIFFSVIMIEGLSIGFIGGGVMATSRIWLLLFLSQR